MAEARKPPKKSPKKPPVVYPEWGGIQAHPISRVIWARPSLLTANNYNPNKVFGPEMALLKHSILTTGWTQPVVARLPEGAPRPLGQVEAMLQAAREVFGDAGAAQLSERAQQLMHVDVPGIIVDGFHRWTLASKDPQVQAASEGLVPTVFTMMDLAHQMAATVRHNRARGQHGVVAMGDIVRGLREQGKTDAEIRAELGMEQEEIDRLSEMRGSPDRVGKDWFRKGWVAKNEEHPSESG